jgi:hypothetical protein
VNRRDAKQIIRGGTVAEWTGLEPATPGVTGRYSNQLNYHSAVADRLPRSSLTIAIRVAEWTGLEPATPGVTGRYSNQLNYHSAVVYYFMLNFKRLLRTAPGINRLTSKTGTP